MFSFKSIVLIAAAFTLGECSEVAVPGALAASLTVPAHVGYAQAIPQNIPPYASQFSVFNRGFAAPLAAPVPAPFAAPVPAPFAAPVGPVAQFAARVAAPVGPAYAPGPYFAGPAPVPSPYAFPGFAAPAPYIASSYAAPYPYAAPYYRAPFGVGPAFVR